MINTELHNELIEKEIENKIVQSNRLIQKEKTQLMIEKLKSVLLIIGVIFIVLLLLTFLYWIFPSKNTPASAKVSNTPTVQCCCDHNTSGHNDTQKKKITVSKDHDRTEKEKRKELKNGVEYVKQDHLVHKKVWKEGELIEDVPLEKTIEDSRKQSKETIPQLAAPQNGSEK